MKIRNLVVLSIAIGLGIVSAAAQKTDGALTFTDHLKRSITISRFGTVLNLRNSAGKEIMPPNVYRICLCGEQGPCIESSGMPSKDPKVELNVESPRSGTTLMRGQTLIITVKFSQGEITVTRRLTWKDGSDSVTSEETITAPRGLCVCTFNPEPKTVRSAMKMCPGPPGLPCPPLPELESSSSQSITNMIEYRIPEQ